MPVVTDHAALLSGYHWGGLEVTGTPLFLTFSFATGAPASHAAPDAMGSAVPTFQAFDAADQALARQALEEWADACGLTFLEVAPGDGDINFSWYDFTGTAYDGAAGVASYPFGNYFAEGSYPYFSDHRTEYDASGDVFINLDYAVEGSPYYGLLLHEIGHAIGLKHPFEIVGSHDETLDPALDNTDNTVMSYTGDALTVTGYLDHDAVAAIYGDADSDGTQVASWSWNGSKQLLKQTGFDTGDTIIGVSVGDKINGRGGGDMLLGLDGKDEVSGGDGDDAIWGGSGKDVLRGDAGDDTIHGGFDDDKVTGGAGDDLLHGETGKDKFIFGAGFGNDVIADFEDGRDRMDLSGIPGVDGIGDLSITGNGVGDAVVTVAGHGTVTLWNIGAGQLTAKDFIL